MKQQIIDKYRPNSFYYSSFGIQCFAVIVVKLWSEMSDYGQAENGNFKLEQPINGS